MNVSCERLGGWLSYLCHLLFKQVRCWSALCRFHTIGCPIFAYPSIYPTRKASGIWTSPCLFLSLWTASSSMKTNCVADRRNSEFWQRIGQPYAHKSGRCFVAVVDIEADSLTSCSNRGGRSPTKGNGGKTVHCPTPFWSGRRAGNKHSPDNAASQIKLFHVKHSY